MSAAADPFEADMVHSGCAGQIAYWRQVVWEAYAKDGAGVNYCGVVARRANKYTLTITADVARRRALLVETLRTADLARERFAQFVAGRPSRGIKDCAATLRTSAALCPDSLGASLLNVAADALENPEPLPADDRTSRPAA